MKKVFLTIAISITLFGCGKKNPARLTTCVVEVRNDSSKELEEWWVDCGKGEVGLGITPSKAFKVHGDVPAVVGAPVSLRWRFSASAMQATNNILGRGVVAQESIRIRITDTAIVID